MKPFSPTSLAQVIAENKNKKLAVTKIIESNPTNLTALPKLIADKDHVSEGSKDNLQLNRAMLETMASQIETNRNNNRNIMKLFPDIELCVQILVSSILSPKKMTDVALIYRLKKDFDFPPTVAASLLTLLQTYITEEYTIEDKLPDIVREALVSSGSYAQGVFPEASVDEIINKDLISTFSTEAFRDKVDTAMKDIVDPINLNGYDFKMALEAKPSAENFIKHLASSEFLSVTDNTNIIKFAELKEEIASDLVRKSYRRNDRVATESAKDKIQYLDIFRQRGQTTTRSNVTFMKTKEETKRKSIGKPMTVRFPSSSVIPIIIPSNPQEHVGYIILQDGDGKPLNMDFSNDGTHNLKGAMFGDGNSAASTPLQIAFKNLIADTNAKVDTNELFAMYKSIVEQQLFSTIKGTLYGKSIDIANKNDIYYIMFMRALSEEKTTLLFVPKELLVYFNFNLNEFGVGKSILDNLSILTSLRAILLFARVMAQAKSAIDVTNVNITFDPRDPDPEKTIAMIQDSTLKLRQNFFPLGINNPVDLVNWIQRAGLKFNYSGHPDLPETKIEFENANIQHSVPDGDLEETLRKQTFQAMGMPPEIVDNAFAPEFAVNVVNNNILLSKRIMLYQQSLTRHLTKLVGLYVFNDETLREKLREEIEKNKDEILAVLDEKMKASYNNDVEAFMEVFLDKLAENVEIDLPKPENTNLTNLGAEFEEYKTGLEKVFTFLMNENTFAEDVSGELHTHLDTLKNIYISQILREWCATNNYFPEAITLISSPPEEAAKLIETISSQMTSTMRNGTLILRKMQSIKDAITSDLKQVTGEGGDGSSPATGDTSSSDSPPTPDEDGGEGGKGGGDLLSF